MTTISLPITDRRRTHDFYTGVFELTAVGQLGPDGIPEPLCFDCDGTQLMFIPTGGEVVLAPTRLPWGMYAATVADPDGNMWLITSTALAPA